MLFQQKIEVVLKALPELSLHGINAFTENSTAANLLLYQEEFEMTCQWLGQLVKSKTLNQRHDSYSIKALAERQLGIYIPNGIMVAALSHCGFKIKTHEILPNAEFNMSQRSINKIERIWLKNKCS